MSLKNIRITSAASFKKKLRTLELALHHAGMHPRYQLYFVRQGNVVYDLRGNQITSLATMRKRLKVPKEAIPVKIGHLVVDYFGKVKAVYAFALPKDAFSLQYLGSTTEYYEELLAYAHAKRIAPGFQYSDFYITPMEPAFTMPRVGRTDEWKVFPWHILTYRMSDIAMEIQVYRPTPKGMKDGVVEDIQFSMYSKHGIGRPKVEPVTLYMAAQSDISGRFRGQQLHPVSEPDPTIQGANWSLTGSILTFGLRLPLNKI